MFTHKVDGFEEGKIEIAGVARAVFLPD